MEEGPMIALSPKGGQGRGRRRSLAPSTVMTVLACAGLLLTFLVVSTLPSDVEAGTQNVEKTAQYGGESDIAARKVMDPRIEEIQHQGGFLHRLTDYARAVPDAVRQRLYGDGYESSVDPEVPRPHDVVPRQASQDQALDFQPDTSEQQNSVLTRPTFENATDTGATFGAAEERRRRRMIRRNSFGGSGSFFLPQGLTFEESKRALRENTDLAGRAPRLKNEDAAEARNRLDYLNLDMARLKNEDAAWARGTIDRPGLSPGQDTAEGRSLEDLNGLFPGEVAEIERKPAKVPFFQRLTKPFRAVGKFFRRKRGKKATLPVLGGSRTEKCGMVIFDPLESDHITLIGDPSYPSLKPVVQLPSPAWFNANLKAGKKSMMQRFKSVWTKAGRQNRCDHSARMSEFKEALASNDLLRGEEASIFTIASVPKLGSRDCKRLMRSSKNHQPAPPECSQQLELAEWAEKINMCPANKGAMCEQVDKLLIAMRAHENQVYDTKL